MDEIQLVQIYSIRIVNNNIYIETDQIEEIQFFISGESQTVVIWIEGEQAGEGSFCFDLNKMKTERILDKAILKLYAFNKGRRMNVKYDENIQETQLYGKFETAKNAIYEYVLRFSNTSFELTIHKNNYSFELKEVFRVDNGTMLKVLSTIEGDVQIVPRLGGKNFYKSKDQHYDVGMIANGENKCFISDDVFKFFLKQYDKEYLLDFCVDIKLNMMEAFYDLNSFANTKELINGSLYDGDDLITFSIIKSVYGGTVIKCKRERQKSVKLDDIRVIDGKIIASFTGLELNEKKRVVLKLCKFENSLVPKCYEYLCQVKKGYIYCMYLTKDFLDGCIKGKDECFECLIVVDDESYKIACCNDVIMNYFEVANGYKIVFYKDKKGYLRIYTHETDFRNCRNKIRVDVWGTCFSRQIFSSDEYFNSDYKMFYKCGYTQFHSSIISLCSEKIDFDLYKYELYFDEAARRYLPAEFEKNFFEQLKSSQPDYLLIDLYADACRPVIRVDEDHYITCNKYMRFIPIKELFGEVEFILPGSNKHQNLLRKYAPILRKRLLSVLDESQLVLLMGRFSYECINEKTGNIITWPWKESIKRDNECWNIADKIFLETFPKTHIIDQRETQWKSDTFSPIVGGATPSHYQRWYYRDSLNMLNKIVLRDLLDKK